jgi:hypothetical protein
VLDGISQNYPGQVAHVEWHVNNSYPLLYCAEARNKWFVYPDEGGYYYYGTLYADGKSQYRNSGSWDAYVANRILVPSDVSLTHVGTTYNPATRNGQVQVECHNAGSNPISAAVQVAITEDSIHYAAPNGDQLHNGVCRDYVPNQNGTAVTLPAGVYDTVTVSYTLQSSWVEENVKLVVYLQKMSLEGDTLATYQGSSSNVLDFTGVEESKLLAARDLRVSVSPNPCRTGCEFTLSGAAARGARIAVYTPDGRLVSSLQTTANSASWNRAGVSRGIYLYRVNAGTATAEGKLVVTD